MEVREYESALEYWGEVGLISIKDSNGDIHQGVVMGFLNECIVLKTPLGYRMWISKDCIVSIQEL